MPLIDADDVPSDNNVFGEEHVRWNTHRKLRDAFSYPPEDELFPAWLDWFYSLTHDQRLELRHLNLVTIDLNSYPKPPSTTGDPS